MIRILRKQYTIIFLTPQMVMRLLNLHGSFARFIYTLIDLILKIFGQFHASQKNQFLTLYQFVLFYFTTISEYKKHDKSQQMCVFVKTNLVALNNKII